MDLDNNDDVEDDEEDLEIDLEVTDEGSKQYIKASREPIGKKIWKKTLFIFHFHEFFHLHSKFLNCEKNRKSMSTH